MPRLAASYDVSGDGKTVLQASYAHYSGKYNDVQFAANTNVGTADAVFGTYTGPAGEGREFAPGFNPANYIITSGAFPTANIFIEDGLRSPVTRELTLGAGREIGNRGYAKLIYTRRRARDFVENFTTLDNGTTTIVRNGVNFGTFNQKVIGWDTTVRPDNAGPKDGNGLPLDYVRGPRFGQPTRNADYPRPRPGLDGGRTFLMAFGVRF